MMGWRARSIQLVPWFRPWTTSLCPVIHTRDPRTRTPGTPIPHPRLRQRALYAVKREREARKAACRFERGGPSGSYIFSSPISHSLWFVFFLSTLRTICIISLGERLIWCGCIFACLVCYVLACVMYIVVIRWKFEKKNEWKKEKNWQKKKEKESCWVENSQWGLLGQNWGLR